MENEEVPLSTSRAHSSRPCSSPNFKDSARPVTKDLLKGCCGSGHR